MSSSFFTPECHRTKKKNYLPSPQAVVCYSNPFLSAHSSGYRRVAWQKSLYLSVPCEKKNCIQNNIPRLSFPFLAARLSLSLQFTLSSPTLYITTLHLHSPYPPACSNILGLTINKRSCEPVYSLSWLFFAV